MTFRLRPIVVTGGLFGLMIGCNMSMAQVESEPDQTQPIIEGVSLDGKLKLISLWAQDYIERNSSETRVHLFSLGFNAQVNDWVKGRLSFQYEEDKTSLDILDAHITLTKPQVSPFFLTAGQMVLPFGYFKSHSDTDPLTMLLGESTEKVVQVGFDNDHIRATAFAYQGDTRDNVHAHTMDHYGFSFDVKNNSGPTRYNFGISYINDMGDTDCITPTIVANHDTIGVAPGGCRSADDLKGSAATYADYDYVDALSGHLHLNAGSFSFYAEYVSALDEFNPNYLAFNGKGAEPKAWLVEGGYTFPLGKRQLTWALGYQGSDEARGIVDPRTGQPTPEVKYYTSFRYAFDERTHISLEYHHDEDYGKGDGGTDEDRQKVLVGLGISF